MERITIQVKDQDKAQALVNFLKALDFVENVVREELPVAIEAKDAADFFALAGLWADREVSIQSLREKAWPYRR